MFKKLFGELLTTLKNIETHLETLVNISLINTPKKDNKNPSAPE
jgi:hypothetical protein